MTALSINRAMDFQAVMAEAKKRLPERLQLNCDMHGPYMASVTRLTKPRIFYGQCPECRRLSEAKEAAKRAEEQRERNRQEYIHLMGVAGVPARFAGRTLAKFKAETPEQSRALSIAAEFATNWDETLRQGRWLVFSGQPGTGKSHLAIAILQAILPMYVGQYMTCMELIQILRSTWRKDSEVSELRMLDRFAKIPLLVIDEVGVQYGTDSEQNHLFDVLDRRYREMMPTILLTNQDKDGFKTFVGERVYDRMTECARWVPFTWQSYRPQARKEMRDA